MYWLKYLFHTCSSHNIICSADFCWGQAQLSQCPIHPPHWTVVGDSRSCIKSHFSQPTWLPPCLRSDPATGYLQSTVLWTQFWGMKKVKPCLDRSPKISHLESSSAHAWESTKKATKQKPFCMTVHRCMPNLCALKVADSHCFKGIEPHVKKWQVYLALCLTVLMEFRGLNIGVKTPLQSINSSQFLHRKRPRWAKKMD